MRKTLKEMLKNPDQIGVGDIIGWYDSGYEKPSKELETLLDAYTESISKEYQKKIKVGTTFRGKRLDNDKWVKGAYFPSEKELGYTFIINNCRSIGDLNDTDFTGHAVKPDSVQVNSNGKWININL
jgi:glycogen synthase